MLKILERINMALPQVQIGGGLTCDGFTPKSRTLSPATTGGAILALKVSYTQSILYSYFTY